jgi:hypothetical protein
MKCLACDDILTDREATRKYASSGKFIDLCDKCFDTVKDQIPSIETSAVEFNDSDSGEGN